MRDLTSNENYKQISVFSKVIIVLVSLLLLVGLSIGATMAYLFLNTDSVTNTFVAATEEEPIIEEEFIGGFTKNSVKVNVGNPGYAVYVRAKVSVNWTGGSSGSEILALYTPAEGEDYEISYNENDWIADSAGYWYYKYPVSSGSTSNLINTCKVINEAPIAGYTLQVDIMTQTIQAVGTVDGTEFGTLAVTGVWGVKVDRQTGQITGVIGNQGSK